MKPQITTIMSLFVAFTLILTACTTPEPVYIFITPTPQPTEEPPDEPTPQITETTEALNADATDNQIEPSTPSPTATIITGEFIGSIIGEDYTLPPTNTPRPIPEPTTEPTPDVLPALDIPRLNGDALGVQVYTNIDIDTFYSMMLQAQKLNVRWIKLQADWSFLQPDGPDQYDQGFRLFESHAQRANNMGFNVLLSVAKAPAWARSVQENYDGTPDDPQQLANFVEMLITRIGRDNLHAIEIWNEPNLLREWEGTLSFDGAGYMQLFAPTYERIRAVAPNLRIVTAALAPTSDSPFSRDDRAFLQEMYDNGLANYTDVAIGVHPYGWANPPDTTCCQPDSERGWDDDPHFFFLDNLNDYSAIIRANGHNAPMWATELGWATWDNYPSAPPEIWMTYTDEIAQAQYLLRSLEITQSREDVEVSIIWGLNFAGEHNIRNSEEIAAYSLIYVLSDVGFQFRPAFDALAQATTTD